MALTFDDGFLAANENVSTWRHMPEVGMRRAYKKLMQHGSFSTNPCRVSGSSWVGQDTSVPSCFALREKLPVTYSL